MASEIIEGRVAPSEPKRSSRGYSLFDPLVITDKTGNPHEYRKVAAAGAVADVLRRGGEGAFHFSKYGGAKGIHGIKLADGTKHYAKFSNVETILLIGIGAGVIALVLIVAGVPDFPVTPLVIGAIMVVAYFVVRSGRIATQRAFDAA